MNQAQQDVQVASVITASELLDHWQGHRNLTRRVIEAFPEKELFSFSIGGMRTFAALSMELLAIGAPGIKEIVTGKTSELREEIDHGNSKAEILRLWDEATEEIKEHWPQIPLSRFHESITPFLSQVSACDFQVGISIATCYFQINRRALLLLTPYSKRSALRGVMRVASNEGSSIMSEHTMMVPALIRKISRKLKITGTSDT